MPGFFLCVFLYPIKTKCLNVLLYLLHKHFADICHLLLKTRPLVMWQLEHASYITSCQRHHGNTGAIFHNNTGTKDAYTFEYLIECVFLFLNDHLKNSLSGNSFKTLKWVWLKCVLFSQEFCNDISWNIKAHNLCIYLNFLCQHHITRYTYSATVSEANDLAATIQPCSPLTALAY